MASAFAVESFAEDSLFAKSGKLVDVGKGSRLSMYCVGSGTPTVVLESGFGGGTAATWSKLQPLLGKMTRTCSYDRAGYGFSSLGSNIPRDLRHAVRDLAVVLRRSGERPPFLLVGHSNGGLIAGAFADLHPSQVAGLVLLDAAVALPEDRSLASEPPSLDASSAAHLARIRRCFARAAEHRLVPMSGDECVDSDWYSSLPFDLAAAEIANRSKPDYWRAYLSEAENNYSSRFSQQARALLPHKWANLPIRVFIASASTMDDEAAAKAFGLNPGDTAALAQARSNRERGEQRQQAVCAFATDCKAVRVPTVNHLVHNEALPEVVQAIRQVVSGIRQGNGRPSGKKTKTRRPLSSAAP